MRQSTFYFLILLFANLSIIIDANANDAQTCEANNLPCLQSLILQEATTIEQSRWKNQAYRDLAVSQAFSGNIDSASDLVLKIDNPDTQAMTIRAIGMAVAIHKDLDDATYKDIFKKLDSVAATITHEGARDIAYTYIAMAQAFAELDEDATITTHAMKNPALKHKAYGETAEIQAERGDYDEALKSINAIDSVAFKNKALSIVSAIFLKKNDILNALNMAMMITNPTKKAASLQKIVNHQLGLDAPK